MRLRAKLADADAVCEADEERGGSSDAASAGGAGEAEAGREAFGDTGVAGKGKKSWGSTLKDFFFGKGGGRDSGKDVGGAAPAAVAQAAGSGRPEEGVPGGASANANAVVVKPPMATPSVQGTMKLSIKVGASSSGSAHAQSDARVPRMMTPLPEEQRTQHICDWDDDDAHLLGYDDADSACEHQHVLSEQALAEVACKQPPAALRIGSALLERVYTYTCAI